MNSQSECFKEFNPETQEDYNYVIEKWIKVIISIEKVYFSL